MGMLIMMQIMMIESIRKVVMLVIVMVSRCDGGESDL